tara:strand:- start:237 stop:1208 length:972 start_codon:yes stop_codon:yes gene_type:complete
VNNRRQVFIINAEPDQYSERAKEILDSFSDTRSLHLGRKELMGVIRDADGLIVRLGYKIDSDFLEAGPNLRFIATATTGLNHVDEDACSKRKIEIISLKGQKKFLESITATAEHTWGLLLSLIRFIPHAFDGVCTGNWDREQFKGRELSGLTLGVVGYGRLGRMIARYGDAFRMNVIATDPAPISLDDKIEFVSFDKLLMNSDIISLHLPLLSSTYNILNAKNFNLIKPGAVLINTSRGELIDEKQLLLALDSGQLSAAAIDVLKNEVEWGRNIPNDHPVVRYAQTQRNLLITPHIAGVTSSSMEKTEIFIANKIKDFVSENL